MGSLRGSLWGPFWGLFGGLAGKTPSKAILEPFRGRSGGPVGFENDHFDWEGCIKSAFPPFRIGAHFGSPAGPILGPIRGSKWCQNRSRSPPGADLENVLQKGPPQEPQMGPQTVPRPPQDPPNPGPRGPQEGPEGGTKWIGLATPLPELLGTPFGTPLGSILGPFWGPFWAHLGSHFGATPWRAHRGRCDPCRPKKRGGGTARQRTGSF